MSELTDTEFWRLIILCVLAGVWLIELAREEEKPKRGATKHDHPIPDCPRQQSNHRLP